MSAYDIFLFDLNYDEQESDAVQKVLESKWISAGNECRELEREFALLHGLPHAVTVSSCTSALTLALHLAGVGSGDEVIVPSLTFVATVNPVHWAGATPVFADVVSFDDWTICPNDVEKKITPKTKAIIGMHYGGFLCDMRRLRTIADSHGICLIEDSAHAVHATRDDYGVGKLGDYACFSFYSNKNVSAGEGGLLTCHETQDAERAQRLRSHGLTTSAFDRARGAAIYRVEEPGYNFRMDDIRGALGRVQLGKFPEDREKREILYEHYLKKLSTIEGVSIPFTSYVGRSGFHVFVIQVGKGLRQELADHLKDRRIQSSYHYAPVHHMDFYLQQPPVKLEVTDALEESIITLPFHRNLTLSDVNRICDAIGEFMAMQNKSKEA